MIMIFICDSEVVNAAVFNEILANFLERVVSFDCSSIRALRIVYSNWIFWFYTAVAADEGFVRLLFGLWLFLLRFAIFGASYNDCVVMRTTVVRLISLTYVWTDSYSLLGGGGMIVRLVKLSVKPSHFLSYVYNQKSRWIRRR